MKILYFLAIAAYAQAQTAPSGSSFPSSEPSGMPSHASKTQIAPSGSSFPSLEPSGMPSHDSQTQIAPSGSSLPSSEPSGMPSHDSQTQIAPSGSSAPSSEPSGMPSHAIQTQISPAGAPAPPSSSAPSSEPTGMPSHVSSLPPSLVSSSAPSSEPTGMPSHVSSLPPSMVTRDSEGLVVANNDDVGDSAVTARSAPCPVVPADGCSVCGDGMCVTLPGAIFEFCGQPAVPCDILEIAGQVGAIPLNQCPFIAGFIMDLCGCASELPAAVQPTPADSGRRLTRLRGN
jgi:hypothetical protein